MYRIIATWKFALSAVTMGAKVLSSGGRALDAAEAGIRLTESDPDIDCVGLGGFLNRDGELELDAAVMDGDTLKTGAVIGIKNYEHPITGARAGMEKTMHNILVGRGAESFAREIGIESRPMLDMITPGARKLWEEKRAEKAAASGHDTIGFLALDSHGSIVSATSTSGMGMKLPGRSGDSPIIGSGFYAESGVGAASATGWGEDIMRTCMSFRMTEMIRAGADPQKAADTAVITACETMMRHGTKPREMAVICLDADGRIGAACNHKGFAYVTAGDGGEPTTVDVEPIIDKDTL